MADDRIGLPGREQPAQVGRVPLHATDPLGHAGVDRPPFEGGERVRTGVDHGDLVTASGQRDRHAAGAAAQVHHVERPPLPRHQLVELVGQQAQQMGLRHGAPPAHVDHAAKDIGATRPAAPPR